MNWGHIIDGLIPQIGGVLVILLFTGVIKIKKDKEEFIKKYKKWGISLGIFTMITSGIAHFGSSAFYNPTYTEKAINSVTSDWYTLNDKGCNFLPNADPTVTTPNEIVQKYDCSVVKKQAVLNSTVENYYHLDCQAKLKTDLMLVKSKDLCSQVLESMKQQGILK